jgi:starch-binding outer membrane protein, SusD/RagB family
MKKIFLYSLLFGVLLSTACKKSDLDLKNPNSPTPDASLVTEAGITNFALGIIQKQLANIQNAGATNTMVFANVHHSIMGDEMFMPYGNYGGRYSDQVYKITLPNGTVVTNPFGKTQYEMLKGFNTRAAGDVNAFQYEWDFCYFYIAHANTLLDALENPALTFSGDAATKKGLLKAWAQWWKGFAYSRLGSLYLSALIYNKTSFTPTGEYVAHDAIIAEANKVLDACAATLSGLTVNDAYTATYKAITPSYNEPNKVITPDMWKRQINTIKARNILVNKKVTAMTSADWNAILSLTNTGLSATDNVFRQGATADGNNDVSGSFFHPFTLIGSFTEFVFVSERLIQEFKAGDERLERNFVNTYDATTGDANYPPNIRSRGLQFGTRWSVVNVEDGGTYASDNNEGYFYVAGSYEENALMKAEALIRTGQIEPGLQLIDQVRVFQDAELPSVAGTGLTAAQALEELRRERRVALFMRNVAFYDARRLGITAPAAQGGGRNGAIVYLPANIIPGLTKNDVRPTFMEYNYVDYFDVPQNEVDFNTPKAGAAPIKN